MSSADPHRLARFLLDRDFDELDPDEQKVIQRVAAGRLAGLDANEKAELTTTFGQRLADRVAAVGGSWGFIIAFGVVLFGWLALNSGVLQLFGVEPFDRYPYIFLNLMLSTLAAVQAPIIMMSQNRQAAKDRLTASVDYEINLRAELEIMRLHHKIDALVEKVDALAVRGDAGGAS